MLDWPKYAHTPICVNESAHELMVCAHCYLSFLQRLNFLAISVTQCQRCLHISRVKNIGSDFELRGVAFRLTPS